MKIICNRDNVIIYVGETVSEDIYGNLVADGSVYLGDLKVYDIAALPTDSAPLKYRYSDTEGFTQNPNYKPTPEEELAQLKESLKTADEKYKDIDLTTAALVDVRNAKMDQLDEACNNTIVAGFDSTVNGASYKFSCSLAAQANFQGTDTLFKDGVITQAEWTVINNDTGKTERINIDQTTFNTLKLQVFQHINSNISKLRNTLQPQVEADNTNADVDKINW